MNKTRNISISLTLLSVAVAATLVVLILNHDSNPEADSPTIIPQVRTYSASPTDYRAEVRGFGRVQPREIIEIKPQISGKIVEQHPQLEKGHRFARGTLLFRIDPDDFKLKRIQAESTLVQALEALKIEKGEQAIAQMEWNMLGIDIREGVESNELPLRKPQLATLEAAVREAEAALKLCELDLCRTEIHASADGIVIDEQVAVGNIAEVGRCLVEMVNAETYRVEIEIPISQLSQLFTQPDEYDRNEVCIVTGQSRIPATFAGILPDTDSHSLFARILIHIDHPAQYPELLLHAFVEVEILGRTYKDAWIIPSELVRTGNRLWMIDANYRLRFESVEIAFSNHGFSVLENELPPDTRIVIDHLNLPVEGMQLKEVPHD